MKRVKDPYKGIRERPLKQVLVEPLDYRILEKLPPEGTTVADLYLVGETVYQLRKQHFPQLSSSLLSTRIRVMNLVDLVVSIPAIGAKGRLAWQVTAKGQKTLDAWKKEHDGSK